MGTRPNLPKSTTIKPTLERPVRIGQLEVKKEFRIKKEVADDEIKEYAETAMNELLGWYGYDKVDSRDTQALNLHHFASNKNNRGRRSPSEDSSDAECARSSSSPGRRDGSSQGSPPLPEAISVPAGCIICSWCNKVASHKMFSLKTPNGQKSFCSELCFTQCRRANFKRNKTCDWCRHIRHTVNYVDFQDGDHQLQFCSDKCLNQYKMNIFCRETEAHLQLHPHLQESSTSSNTTTNTAGLITPDLWMRDCRSESPSSDRSNSPNENTSPLEIKVVVRPDEHPVKQPPPSLEITKIERKDLPKEKLRRSNLNIRARRLKSSFTATSEHRASSSSPRSAGSLSPPKPNLFPPPLLPLNGTQMPPMNMMHPNIPHDHPMMRPPHFFPPGFFPPPHMIPPDHPILRNPPRFPQMLRPPLVTPPSPPSPQPRPPTFPPPPRSLLPPVTILVPCPVPLIIPIPIFIPIPPDMKFKSEEKEETKENSPTTEAAKPQNPPSEERGSSSVPRPIRKRKRMTEIPPDEDCNITKRKTVPV